MHAHVAWVGRAEGWREVAETTASNLFLPVSALSGERTEGPLPCTPVPVNARTASRCHPRVPSGSEDTAQVVSIILRCIQVQLPTGKELRTRMRTQSGALAEVTLSILKA